VTLPALWGILNVTPDSFSDGGFFLDPDRAVARAHQLVAQGATVIDIGAESSRPGAKRTPADEEKKRLRPVVDALADQGITISVDTMRAETAVDMVERGAHIVNDISGGRADPEMVHAVAALDVDYVMMHWRGHSDQMETHAVYDDVAAEVSQELQARIDEATQAGIAADRIVIDPGFGFSKDIQHNWQLTKGLHTITSLGFPVLVGASRKRFLGALLAPGHDAADSDGVSAVFSVWAAQKGVSALRVHEPRVHAEALALWQAATNGVTP